MTIEQIKPLFGEYVLVRTDDGQAYIGELGGSLVYGFVDVLLVEAQPGGDRVHQNLAVPSIATIEVVSPEYGRELRGKCHCNGQMDSWVDCPLHAPPFVFADPEFPIREDEE
jgi:hypothetical protein